MPEFFLKLVNMSISASWLVLAVLVLRLLLKKAPKWVNVLLWGMVAVRLVCPVSIESILSLLPSSETINTTAYQARPYIQSGIPVVDNRVNNYLGSHYREGVTVPVDHFDHLLSVFTVIWLVGMAVMLAYTAVSYLRLRRRVGTAIQLRENIFQSERVVSPFVLGIIRPRIYLPFGMSQQDMAHVVAHEQAHIRRRDHWWKPLGFLLLTLHWFNPLMWLAYILLCRDIELACDEKVIKELGSDARADYSQALLSCSVSRKSIAACPLAFGEVGVKERVKNVLSYKKPAFWIIVCAVIACIALAVCFLTDPKRPIEPGGNMIPFPALEDLPSDYTLEQAKLDGCVVMEDGDVTAGQDIWMDFVTETHNGNAASVRYVTYYTLDDPSRYASDYYESIKDDYPSMYVHDLVFDGENYTVRWYEDNKEIVRTYRYLMQYIGKPDSPYALYDSFIRYVMTNDNTVTWEDIWNGMISSQFGDYIDHLSVYSDSVYSDLVYANEPVIWSAGDRLAQGRYIPVECIYMTPLSSYYPANVSQDYYYTVTDDSFITGGSMMTQESETRHIDWKWQTYDRAKKELLFLTETFFYPLIRDDALYQKIDGRRHILLNDGTLYLIAGSNGGKTEYERLWSIYILLPEDDYLAQTNARIEGLIETIAATPAYASDPGSYIEHNREEYDELLSCGVYTLRCCFSHFLQGGETGLEGHIMALACQDIMAGWGEAVIIESSPATGQAWFREFRSSAEALPGQYSDIEIQSFYPGAWTLLQML